MGCALAPLSGAAAVPGPLGALSPSARCAPGAGGAHPWRPGATVGYGSGFVTRRPTRIAWWGRGIAHGFGLERSAAPGGRGGAVASALRRLGERREPLCAPGGPEKTAGAGPGGHVRHGAGCHRHPGAARGGWWSCLSTPSLSMPAYPGSICKYGERVDAPRSLRRVHPLCAVYGFPLSGKKTEWPRRWSSPGRADCPAWRRFHIPGALPANGQTGAAGRRHPSSGPGRSRLWSPA